MPKIPQETRKNKAISFYACEVRANEDSENGAYIEGLPIVYESKTDMGCFSETVKAGALSKCDLKDVKFLVNHNLDMIPLARSRNNNENSTMQLKPNEKGMGIRVNLDIENNSDAKSLYSAVKRGDISGMSFMFNIDTEEWTELDSDYPHRDIISISKVFEVSAVTFPAYEETEITARSTLDSVRSALDSARGDSHNSDELEMLKIKNENLIGG